MTDAIFDKGHRMQTLFSLTNSMSAGLFDLFDGLLELLFEALFETLFGLIWFYIELLIELLI